ncbi:MAG: hypothetical protein RI932_1352 [Pseudomonadota bacterium]|jgi:hypothetical protein
MRMHFIFQSILVAICVSLSSSCSAPQERKAGGEKITADVLSMSSTAPSSPGQSPSFEYGPKTFALIDDLENLKGAGLSMLQGGDLEIFERTGTIFSNAFFVGGTKPVLEYRLADGVVKSKSSKSLAMLSSMYQFDSLVNELEKISGISQAEFRSRFGDFQVLFQPSIVLNANGEQIRKYETTNAAYVAGARQFALFKTSDLEKIPLSFNPQIISHEFGHSIFEYSFFDGKYQNCSLADAAEDLKVFKGRLELEYIVRGINEGFADFVSFVWTGSSNILESSLGTGKGTDERNFVLSNFDYSSIGTEASRCKGQFYCVGTLWASALLDVYKGLNLDVRNAEQRKAFLRNLVGYIKSTGSRLRANNGAALPEADDDIRRCRIRQFREAITDDRLLGAFLKSFVETLPASERSLYCSKLANRFGTAGFAVEYRGSCS